MTTYKITNITNHIGKRELKHESVLDIEYVDSMVKKVIKLKPSETIYLTISSLPLSIHKLRVKKLITVDEVNHSELMKIKNNTQQTTVKKENVEVDKKNIQSNKVHKERKKT